MRNRYDMQLHLLDTQLTHMGELSEASAPAAAGRKRPQKNLSST